MRQRGRSAYDVSDMQQRRALLKLQIAPHSARKRRWQRNVLGVYCIGCAGDVFRRSAAAACDLRSNARIHRQPAAFDSPAQQPFVILKPTQRCILAAGPQPCGAIHQRG